MTCSDRNSYFKIDKEMMFMRMKEDCMKKWPAKTGI